MKPKRRQLTPNQKAAIIQRQGNRCACGCGEKFTDPRDIEFDHVLDLQWGGTNDLDNFAAKKRRHHLEKTKTAAKERAKADRIRKGNLKHQRKMSAADRAIAKRVGMEV